jgi:hypothetical protein
MLTAAPVPWGRLKPYNRRMPLNSVLQSRLRYLRSRYFAHRLPRDIVVIWTKSTDYMGMATMEPPYIIAIDPELAKWHKVWELTLLHELCHISSGDATHKRGGPWDLEMHRLAAAQAFRNLW